jgi:N-acetylglutamate synthase-like GNAT family acetyltransferase
MLKLVPLCDHIEFSDSFSFWLHQHFSYEFGSQPLLNWQQEFREGQTDGNWATLIAIEEGQLLGGAALAKSDLSDRPHLGPWLACVFVAPEVRGRGLAEQLITDICSQATAKGYKQLYLHTHDRHEYYAKRGWEYVERFQAWGKEHWLMRQVL